LRAKSAASPLAAAAVFECVGIAVLEAMMRIHRSSWRRVLKKKRNQMRGSDSLLCNKEEKMRDGQGEGKKK
jgi:hypothetical protein